MQERAYDAFREALLDLSDEPSPLNVLRYLAASRTLAHASTTAAPAPASRAARTSRRAGAATHAANGKRAQAVNT
jgi:hypothetical protein